MSIFIPFKAGMSVHGHGKIPQTGQDHPVELLAKMHADLDVGMEGGTGDGGSDITIAITGSSMTPAHAFGFGVIIAGGQSSRQ